jgi:invasion protein IalB
MAKSHWHSGVGARLAGAAALAVTLLIGGSFVLSPVPAQAQKKADKKASAPASTKSTWVKLCAKETLTGKNKEGKEVKKDLNICETVTERLDGTSGMTIINAGLRQMKLDKEEKQKFMVTLPHGVLLPAGATVTFFPKDVWAKVEKNEKLEKADEEKLKQVKLPFLFCSLAGCHVDSEFKDDGLKILKSSSGFIVTIGTMAGIGIHHKVSLAGFNETSAGPPTDTKKFAEGRKQLMMEIKARRDQMIAQYKKEQEDLNKMQPNVGGDKKAPAKK